MVFAQVRLYTPALHSRTSATIEFLGKSSSIQNHCHAGWLLVQNIFSFVSNLLKTKTSELDPVFQVA